MANYKNRGERAMKILGVGSHFDDLELSAGGTLAKFIKAGHEVFINVVANSFYTSYNGKILRNNYQSKKEGFCGLTTLGIKKVNIKNLEFITKEVPFNVHVIEAINKSIDLIKPDLIITHHPYAESHPDHINTAKSTLAAARRCNTIWCFEPLYPSKVSSIPFKPVKYIDISEFMNVKIESLKQHVSQWEKYPDWESLVRSLGRVRGIEMQTEFGESFEIIKDSL